MPLRNMLQTCVDMQQLLIAKAVLNTRPRDSRGGPRQFAGQAARLRFDLQWRRHSFSGTIPVPRFMPAFERLCLMILLILKSFTMRATWA